MSLTNAPTISNVNENWLFQFTADNETCLDFDGTNDRVELGNILSTYTSYTIEAWIKPDTVSTSGKKFIIYRGNQDYDENTEANNVSFSIFQDDNDLGFHYQYGASDNQTSTIAGNQLSANTWTHIALTRNNDDNEVKLYVNGAHATTITGTNDPTGGTSGNLFIGFGEYNGNQFFDGKIAHVRIWSATKFSEEIANNYLNGIDNTASNLVGYWKLNEGSGTTALDSSANSNNGTISGATFLTNEFDKYIFSFGLSFRDATVDNNFYHGSVVNRSISIRESIDITKGTANTSNISITSANFKIRSTEFYKTLFNYAETNLINKKVIVYSQFFNNTSLSNCQKIFIGRLVDLKLNQKGNVTFQVNTKRPWDGISFPQTQTTNGIYQPVVYGDYTIHGDKSLVREHANELFPVPFKHKTSTTDFLIVTPVASTDIRPCYYDATADAFLGIKADNYTAATKDLDSSFDANTNIGIVKREMRRRFRINPVSISQEDTTTFTNPQNLLIDSYSVQGITHEYLAQTGGQAKNFYANFAAELGKINDVDFDLKGTVSTGVQTGTVALLLRISFSGDSEDFISANVPGSYNNVSFIDSSLNDVNIAESDSNYISAGLTISNNNINTVNLSTTINSSTNPRVLTITISDFVMYLDVQHSYDESKANTNVSIANLSNLKYLYLPIDGLPASWDNGAITHGHDAHRDLLQRFAGISSSDPVGWSDLNTDRAIDNWKIRYWQLEPVKLKDILDKLAYEFGFVAKYTATEELKYIYVKQSTELSATLNLTKDDITNVNIATTGINNVITEMQISNKLHPAVSNRYYNTVTAQNSTSRIKYNLGDKEGIQAINLNAHVGAIPTSADSDCNADFYSYYNNIVGDIKMLVSCDIVNPAKGYQLETGDIITFTDMPVELFNTNFSGSIFFMIVEYKRSPGKVSITAREVS